MRAVMICSNPVLGRLLLPALRREGAHVSLICEPQSRHLRLSRACDGVLLECQDVASEDPDRVVAAINHQARGGGVDCVLASDVRSTILLSGIASRLECPVFPVAAAEVLRRLDNKWQFYMICRNLGVPAPITLHYSAKADIDPEQIASVIGYPVVVKPVGQWSSIGVAVVDTERQLLSDIVHNPDYAFDDLIVQQYLKGEDAGFGGLAVDGKLTCWTTFLLPGGGAVTFTPLPRLLAAAEAIVAGLRFSGIINLDARVDMATGEAGLIECNPRFFVRVQASRLCGLDFVRAGLALGAAGAGPPQSLTQGRFLSPGRLSSWAGVRQFLAGDWQLGAFAGAISETLGDPMPRMAENFRWLSPQARLSLKPA